MIVLCPKITFKQITSKKRSSFLIPSFITVATYQALQKEGMTARELMKMISGWPGTPEFWVKMTQKFGKEARVANATADFTYGCALHTLVLLLYLEVIMEGAILLVSL